jgi:PPOX class probable F420-dependent enzyme
MSMAAFGICRATRTSRSATIGDMRDQRTDRAVARIDRMLRTETVVWLSSVGPSGTPHLVPIWFSWDGERVLIASKPHARKVANLRANPSVMLALGEPDDDFDVGMIEGVAELLDAPARHVLPATHLAKYAAQMRAIGLTADEFLATYSQVIGIRPTRFLPWHGRTTPANAPVGSGLDRRLAAAIRRVAAGAVGPAQRPFATA